MGTGPINEKEIEVQDIKKVAVDAALKSGKFMMEHLNELRQIEHKDGINNLVTDVDRGSEKIIIDTIKQTFPDHSILAEESGRQDHPGDYTWVIDPLDGTTNYAHRFPFFCVSIGVMRKDEIVAGVVYEPTRDELFSAVQGKGAFLNGQAISVSNRKTVIESLISTGFPYSQDGKKKNLEYFKKMLGKSQAVRRPGAAALDLCYVACGRVDGFWEFGLQPWDTAAGKLIVEEAGGTVSTISMGTYDVFKKEILATNTHIHNEIHNLLCK